MSTTPRQPHDAEEARLARVYGALPGGEPSAALDARILANARAAVRPAAPARRRPWFLGAGLGTAAAAVFAAGIAWQLGVFAPDRGLSSVPAQQPAAAEEEVDRIDIEFVKQDEAKREAPATKDKERDAKAFPADAVILDAPAPMASPAPPPPPAGEPAVSGDEDLAAPPAGAVMKPAPQRAVQPASPVLAAPAARSVAQPADPVLAVPAPAAPPAAAAGPASAAAPSPAVTESVPAARGEDAQAGASAAAPAVRGEASQADAVTTPSASAVRSDAPPADAAPREPASGSDDRAPSRAAAGVGLDETAAQRQQPPAKELERRRGPAPLGAVAGGSAPAENAARDAGFSPDAAESARLAKQAGLPPWADDIALAPAAWLERIRDRVQAGDRQGAEHSLRRFVLAHPAQRVPRDLQRLLAE